MNLFPGIQLFTHPFRDPVTDEPLALGTVQTNLASSALSPTFADANLLFPNPNPMTLDASGFATMFFSPLAGGTSGVSYDILVKNSLGVVKWTYTNISVPVPTASGNATNVVIGHGSASTLTIAGGSITPTKNVHLVSPEGGAADNLDTIAITSMPDGARLTISNTNGSAPITVRNNMGNIFTSDGQNVVLSTTAQRLSLIRYGANWQVDSATATSINQGNNAATGRLTLQSGVPVPTSDLTLAPTIFYTPYNGNVIDLYDGTANWTRFPFNELSLPIILAANGLIDLFVFNNGGVVTLTAGTPWTNATTRATGLTRQNGVLVLASDTRLRYVGTVGTTTAANQSEDSQTSRLCWNYYNRTVRPMRRSDPTPAWAYNVAAFRQANANTANQLKTVVGITEDPITLEVRAKVTKNVITAACFVAVGLDSTTTPASGFLTGQGTTTDSNQVLISSPFSGYVPEGRHLFVWLEIGDAGGATFEGSGGTFVAGIYGSVIG